MKWQCPQCKSPRVTSIDDNMLCLNCGLTEFLYDYPSAFGLVSLPEEPSPQPTLAPDPEWTRWQWDKVNQLRAEVNYLRKELAEHTELGKRTKGQY